MNTVNQKRSVDFDKLAEALGGLGRYQILIFLLGCFSSFMAGIIAVISVFTEYKNPHRCYIPACDNSYSFYNETFVNFSVPRNEETHMFDECSMYESASDTYCFPEVFHRSRTTKCERYVYDKDVFQSTTVQEFDLVCERSYLLPLGGSAYMFGLLIGSFVIGAISDKYGRKTGLLVSALIYVISGVGSAAASNYSMFLVFRAFSGAGGMGLFQVAFVIAVELIGAKWRSFYGIIIEVPFAVGEIATGVLAYYIRDWRWLIVACVSPGVFLFSYYCLMPESVRWLVSQNRIDEAVKLVDGAARINGLQSPSHLLTTNLKTEDESEFGERLPEKKRSKLDIFKAPRMRKRTCILFFSWAVCTLAYYGLSTNSGNLSGNLFINYSLTMFIEIPAYFVSYFLLERIGRKGTLMGVFIFSGLACLISAFLPSDMAMSIMVLSLLGKFGIAAAFGSIFIYTAELFPTEYRSIGVGSCSTCARVGGILAPVVSNLSSFYKPLPLLIFGTLSFIAGFLILPLPETLGTDLPQTLQQSEDFGKDESYWDFSCCKKKERNNSAAQV